MAKYRSGLLNTAIWVQAKANVTVSDIVVCKKEPFKVVNELLTSRRILHGQIQMCPMSDRKDICPCNRIQPYKKFSARTDLNERIAHGQITDDRTDLKIREQNAISKLLLLCHVI